MVAALVPKLGVSVVISLRYIEVGDSDEASYSYHHLSCGVSYHNCGLL